MCTCGMVSSWSGEPGPLDAILLAGVSQDLVWPATTVFLSKRLLFLAQGAWWDGRSRPD